MPWFCLRGCNRSCHRVVCAPTAGSSIVVPGRQLLRERDASARSCNCKAAGTDSGEYLCAYWANVDKCPSTTCVCSASLFWRSLERPDKLRAELDKLLLFATGNDLPKKRTGPVPWGPGKRDLPSCPQLPCLFIKQSKFLPQ